MQANAFVAPGPGRVPAHDFKGAKSVRTRTRLRVRHRIALVNVPQGHGGGLAIGIMLLPRNGKSKGTVGEFNGMSSM